MCCCVAGKVLLRRSAGREIGLWAWVLRRDVAVVDRSAGEGMAENVGYVRASAV